MIMNNKDFDLKSSYFIIKIMKEIMFKIQSRIFALKTR